MPDKVTAWLERHGLGQYSELFHQNAIEEDVLPDLTDADLRELGLPLGHRKKLLKALAALHSESLTESPSPNGSGAPDRKSADAALDAERRHLTVMFCDLVGSTALSERLDLEAYREVLAAFQEAARQSIHSYDGYIARYMGDGLLVYFGYPQAHEDDAERAVRAGLDLIGALGTLNVPGDVQLRARVGIATGRVVAGDIVGEGASEEHAVLGETPNLAARLQGLAMPDTVVISEATHNLVRGRFQLDALPPQTVKGLSEPVLAYRATAVIEATRFEAATAKGLFPFVGRQTELRLLLDRWNQARSGEGQVVLLSGEPGIGKSRMLRELAGSLAEQPHLEQRYQCRPYASKIAFSPVVDQLHESAGMIRSEPNSDKLDKLEQVLVPETLDKTLKAAPLLATLLSLPVDRYPPISMTPQRQKLETIAVLVSRLEGLARDRPVLVLVEDVHWVDPSTRETLDAMIERASVLPVLLVITHRPEFESPWQQYGHVTQVSLNRLNRGDGRMLSERVTEGRALPENVIKLILERTDGVPLFIEEVTKTVLEGGALYEENGRFEYKGTAAPIAIPETVQDSLMARLDHLGSAKELAQAAACVGREFSMALLSKVLTTDSLDDDMRRLLDAGLVFKRTSSDEPTFIFKHALVQDAAYDSMLVSKQRQLHARIANALARSEEEEPGVVARHFSAAGDAAEAAAYFLAAGQRALSVSALTEAAGELEMGLQDIQQMTVSPERDRLELDLRTMLGAARIASRGWPHASVANAYEPAFDLATGLDDKQALAVILWGLCVHYWTRGEFPQTHVWLDRLEDTADRTKDSGLSVVRDMSAGCQYFWEADYERAFAYTSHIRKTYDLQQHGSLANYLNHDPLTFSLHWAASLLKWIEGYPDQGLEMVNEAHALAREIGHPFNTTFALTGGSECLLMRGDTEHMLRCCDEAQQLVTEAALGEFAQHVLIDNWRGRTLTRMGDFENGYRLTHIATTGWREAEGKICSAMFWGGEAIALAGLGRTEEALSLVEAAIAHCRQTGDRYMEPEVLRLRAELMLQRDDTDTDRAEATLNEAMRVARDHSAKSWELRIATTLAGLWSRQNRAADARALLEPIFEWFTEGFETMDLKDARSLLEDLS